MLATFLAVGIKSIDVVSDGASANLQKKAPPSAIVRTSNAKSKPPDSDGSPFNDTALNNPAKCRDQGENGWQHD
jgi:hypothetical protein